MIYPRILSSGMQTNWIWLCGEGYLNLALKNGIGVVGNYYMVSLRYSNSNICCGKLFCPIIPYIFSSCTLSFALLKGRGRRKRKGCEKKETTKVDCSYRVWDSKIGYETDKEHCGLSCGHLDDDERIIWIKV